MLLKARLVAEHMSAFYETIERPLVPVVAAMEDAGVKVDRAALAELSRDFARRIAELESAIWRDVGNEFNIGSTKQLGDVLFEKLQLPGGKKGKTGAYGTDAGMLETARAIASGAGAGARMAPAHQAQIDLCRCARRGDRRQDRARPYLIRAGCDGDRAAVVDPSPTSRTSRSAPRRGARSAAPLSPSRGTCCCRPITARSSCASPRMSPISPS